MNTNIKLNCKFDNVTEALEATLNKEIKKNLEWKMSSYFNKVFKNNKDGEILVQIVFTKNKKDKYEWSFRFNIDWEKYNYSNDVPFVKPVDLINNAFDHLKEYLSNK